MLYEKPWRTIPAIEEGSRFLAEVCGVFFRVTKMAAKANQEMMTMRKAITAAVDMISTNSAIPVRK